MGLLEKVKLSDLDDEQKQLASLIGLENYKSLVKEYGGLSIYIPKVEGFEMLYRNEKIKEEFDGYNYKQLAKKYGLSEVRIRVIVNDICQAVRTKPMDGQVKLY